MSLTLGQVNDGRRPLIDKSREASEFVALGLAMMRAYKAKAPLHSMANAPGLSHRLKEMLAAARCRWSRRAWRLHDDSSS